MVDDVVAVVQRQPYAAQHGDGHEQQVKEHVEIRPAEFVEKFSQTRYALGKEQFEQSAPHALVALERVGDGGGLILVDDGVGDVLGLDPFEQAVHRELGVVGRGQAVPPAVLADNLGREHHARPAQHLRGVQESAHMAGVAAVADIPQPRNARNDVFGQVLAVGVAARAHDPRVERVVHLRYVVRLHEVIGVELDKKVVSVVVGHDLLKAVLQRVPRLLVPGIVVEMLENDRPGVPGDLGGVVGAVVRHDEHVEQFLRVIGIEKTLHRVADDGRLVARRYDDSHSVFDFGRFVRLFGHPEKEYIQKLCGKRDGNEPYEDVVYPEQYLVE